MECETCRFGIRESGSLSLANGSVNGAYNVAANDVVFTSNKGMFRFHSSELTKSVPISILCSTYSPDLKLFFVVSIINSGLTIIPLSDLTRKLVSDAPLHNAGITHMVFSPKSGLLVTYGDQIKIYNLGMKPSPFSFDPDGWTFDINEIGSINVEAPISLLSAPSFNFKKEKIYLQSAHGIKMYNTNGSYEKTVTKIPYSPGAIFTNLQNKGKFFSYEMSTGACFTNAEGLIKKKFYLGNSPIFSAFFVDDENVVCMNSKYMFYLLNVKTGREFASIKLNQTPSRIFYSDSQTPQLFISFGSHVMIYDVLIYWKTWHVNILKSKQITRVPKMNKAARLLISGESLSQIYSPANKECFATCSAPKANIPIFTLYDRGTIVNKRNPEETSECEKIISVMEDGSIGVFEFDETNSCKFVHSFPLKALKIIRLYIDKWYYGVITINYEFMIYDTFFHFVKRYIYPRENLLDVHYFHPSQVVIISVNRIFVLDLLQQKVVDQVEFKQTGIAAIEDDFLYFGSQDGTIYRYSLSNLQSSFLERRAHSDQVEGFSFSDSLWVSISKDCSILVWDKNFMCLKSFEFPIQLRCVAFLNGHRDLLLATESEIMIINHERICNEEDDEIESIDNYDKLRDSFSMKYEKKTQNNIEEEKPPVEKTMVKKIRSPRQKFKESWERQMTSRQNSRESLTTFNSTNDENKNKESEEEEARKKALQEMLDIEAGRVPLLLPPKVENSAENTDNKNDDDDDDQVYEYATDSESPESSPNQSKLSKKKKDVTRSRKKHRGKKEANESQNETTNIVEEESSDLGDLFGDLDQQLPIIGSNKAKSREGYSNYSNGAETSNWEDENGNINSQDELNTKNGLKKATKTKNSKNQNHFLGESYKKTNHSSIEVSKNKRIEQQRSSSPPQIRKYSQAAIIKTNKKKFRCQTPLPRSAPKKVFTMPPPCVVIDEAELMKQYIRGKTEFLPLIKRLRIEITVPPQIIETPNVFPENLNEDIRKISTLSREKMRNEARLPPLQKVFTRISPRNAPQTPRPRPQPLRIPTISVIDNNTKESEMKPIYPLKKFPNQYTIKSPAIPQQVASARPTFKWLYPPARPRASGSFDASIIVRSYATIKTVHGQRKMTSFPRVVLQGNSFRM